MKIIRNDKMIKRNARIGQFTSLAGLATLGAGLYISFAQPEMIGAAWGALLLGFLLSQVGIFFGNRWGRRPRPDEHLDEALKGLDDRYHLYHYSSPVSHLLTGPAGLWLLMPRHQGGRITFEKGRWRQRGGGIFQAYLRAFAQEGLGRPDLDYEAETSALKRHLEKNLPDEELPEIQAALVMTNENAVIEAVDAPFPAVQAKKLKDLIRKSAKESGLAPTRLEKIQGVLE